MDRNDQQAIDDLFEKLAEVGRQSPPRDADAERYIAERFTRLPGAAYFMAQTVIMQDHALTAAQRTIEDLQARIDEVERSARAADAQPAPGGFLSGLFGDSSARSRPSGAVPRVGRPRTDDPDASPWGSPRPSGVAAQQPYSAMPQQRAGGGFLAGAAQTAMGVAGGVLLGNMFGGHSAQAAEAPKAVEPQPEPPHHDDAQPAGDQSQATPSDQQNAGYQDAAYDDAGGYDGGFGDDMDI